MANRKELPIYITAYDKFSKVLRSFSGILKGIARSFFNLKTAILGAVGVGGLGLLVKNSLAATNSLAKTAGKIGTTTEALSALQYAGQLTGVEVNTMNMALQRFTRRTAEAAVGTGEAKGALRELGVDARKLLQLPLDEQMLTLADAFEEAKNKGVNPLKIAFKLFDSEGAALVNTLALGRTGLTELLGEARALGVVMSSSAAKGVEDANDALFRMQSLFGGIVKQTVAALAPALSAFADLVTKEVKNGIKSASDSVENFAIVLAGQFLDGAETALRALQDLLNGFVSVANFVNNFKQGIDDLFGSESQQSVQFFNEQLAIQQKQLKDLQKLNEDLGGGAYDVQIARIQEIIADLEAQKSAAEAAGRVMDRFGRFTFAEDAIPIFEILREAARGYTQDLSDMGDEMSNQLPSSFQAFMQNLEQARKQGDDLQTGLVKLASQGIDGLGKSFTAAITGAHKFSDAIKSMAKSVIDSLIQMLIQKYIVDAAFGAIVKMIDPSQDASRMGGDGFGPPAPRALGGPVTGNRPYLVGERGPELMVPAGNGSIIPNNALGGGGVTVVQHINITTGVQQTVRAEIANLLPQISNAAKSAVADARMRGGGFSKAMVGV